MPIQTDQINDALTALQAALTDALNAGPYSQDLQDTLDNTTLQLQTIQNDLLAKSEQDLLDALSANNTQFKKLNADIDAYADSLHNAAVTVKKVSNAIAITVTVISAVVSAGLL